MHAGPRSYVWTRNLPRVRLDPDDPGALATAMARLASDHAFADRLGQSGRLRAEVFAWSKIADEYQAVYDRLLAS